MRASRPGGTVRILLGVCGVLIFGLLSRIDIAFVLFHWLNWARSVFTVLCEHPDETRVIWNLWCLFGALVIGLLTAGAVFPCIKARFQGVGLWLLGDSRSSSRSFWFTLAFLTPFAAWWPSLRYASFLWDDYFLLADVHQYPLLSLMTSIRNDHFYPVFWLQWKVLWELFGSWHLPYLLMSLLSMATAQVGALFMLREMRAARLALIAVVLLICGWTYWGLLVTGWNILAQYIQVVALAFLGLGAQLRAFNGKGERWTWIGVIAACFAPWIALAGIWVPCSQILAIYFLSDRGTGLHNLPAATWKALLSIVMLTGIYTGTYLYLKAAGNAGSSMGPLEVGNLLAQYAHYWLFGLVLPLVVPAASVYMPLQIRFLLALAVVIPVGLMVFRTLRGGSTPFRWISVVLLFDLALFGALACIGRPEASFYFDWDIRITGQAWFLFAVLLSLVASQIVTKSGRAGAALVVILLLGCNLLLNLSLSHGYGEVRGNSCFGYQDRLVFAEGRRADADFVIQELLLPLSAQFSGSDKRLPEMYQEDLVRAFPDLVSMTHPRRYAILDERLRDDPLFMEPSPDLDPEVAVWLAAHPIGRQLYYSYIKSEETP